MRLGKVRLVVKTTPKSTSRIRQGQVGSIFEGIYIWRNCQKDDFGRIVHFPLKNKLKESQLISEKRNSINWQCPLFAQQMYLFQDIDFPVKQQRTKMNNWAVPIQRTFVHTISLTIQRKQKHRNPNSTVVIKTISKSW